MADEKSKNFSDEEIDRILNEYSAINKDRVQSTQEPEKKKFVLHIDESLMDSVNIPEEKKKNDSAGIYFLNYQKKGTKNSTNPRTSVQSKPVLTKTQSTAVKAKTQVRSIGGKAAIGFLAFILVSTILLSYIGLTCVGDMLAINRSEDNVEVVIPPDSKYSDIIDILKDKGLIKRAAFCKVFTKYRGFDEEEYLSGNYYLNSNMGVEGMLMDVMAAPVSAESIDVTIPEGWTIQQIFEKIEKFEVCDSNKLYSAIRSASYDKYNFIADIADDANRYTKLEGYLFPDTYDFYVDADANYVIKKFLDNFKAKWEDEYDSRAEKLGRTRDEIITIASIIQKEAANESQMKVISSIIHNRLNDPANFPTLGCDSTAIYISNYVTPTIGEAQGRFFYDNYDTSAIRGLPPGPICNPGIDAIKAALYPEETDYYFFAHDNSGRIYTAKTLNEHRNNLVKIIRANGQ